MVGGLVEDQHVGARLDEDGQREAPPLAARQPAHRLLGLLAAEQEAPEQGARLVGRQAGGTLRRFEDRAGRSQLLGVLGEVAELDVVAGAPAPAVERAPAGEGVDQSGLAGTVRPDERHVLAPLEPQIAFLEQGAPGNL